MPDASSKHLYVGTRRCSMIQKKSTGYTRALPISYLFKNKLEQFEKYIPGRNHIFLSTGRCAIKLAIRTLGLKSKDEVLLPSYLCPEGVLGPFREENITIKFYKIKKDLSIDIADLESKISNNTKALFIIHYFGFPQPIDEISELCKNKKLFLIEDCAHAFLGKYQGKLLGSFGDLSIFTYRKTLPVPDGALLVSNNPSLRLMEADKNFDLIRSLYPIIETSSLILGDAHSYFNIIAFLSGGLSYVSKRLMNIYHKPANPSYLSQSLIRKFDLDEIISRKKENFRYLLENLDMKDITPLYTELPDGVCPLWFPVLTDKRDYLRKKLRKNGIFTPIFWKLPNEISRIEFHNSWDISTQILSIPIGSIRTVDMSYVVNILNK